MELVPDYQEPPPRKSDARHPIRWTLVVIAAIIVVANWRVVAALLVVVALVVVLISFVVVISFLRKMSRPIGQLSMLDVAYIAWVYRRWEKIKARRPLRSSVLRK
jgi:hypothetical protein